MSHHCVRACGTALVAKVASFALLFLCTLATAEVNSHGNTNEFTLKSEDIAKILLCKEVGTVDDLFGGRSSSDILSQGHLLEPLGSAITNRVVIESLCESFSEMHFGEPKGIPAIGILSYQVFFNKDGKILGITWIPVFRGTVLVSSGFIEKNRIVVAQDDVHSQAAGQSVRFCRAVYDVMRQQVPAEIEQLDASYRHQAGVGLEALLFGSDRF